MSTDDYCASITINQKNTYRERTRNMVIDCTLRDAYSGMLICDEYARYHLRLSGWLVKSTLNYVFSPVKT